MLQLLQTPRTIIVDGQARTISAPTNEIKNRCFARMRNSLDLAREVIRSDFPEFESLQLFSVFRLQDSTLPQTSALNKLADFLHVNPAQFAQEFQHIWPITDWHFRNGATSQESAWQQAFNNKLSLLFAVGGGDRSNHIRHCMLLFCGICRGKPAPLALNVYLGKLIALLRSAEVMCLRPGSMTNCSPAFACLGFSIKCCLEVLGKCHFFFSISCFIICVTCLPSPCMFV